MVVGKNIYFSTYANSKPLLSQLHILKSGSGKVVKVKESVCAQWGSVATQLILSPNLINISLRKIIIEWKKHLMT